MEYRDVKQTNSNKVMEYRDVKQHIVAKSWNIGMQNITEYQSQETSVYKRKHAL